MLLKRRKRGKGKLLGPQGVVGGGCRGGGRMGRRGGAVICSKEAAEKASSRSWCFMKYHSFTMVL